MVVKPSAGKEQPITIRRVSKPVDFYKVVYIPYAHGEVLACATRKDGITALPFQPEANAFVSSLTYPGLDVVDVCSLGQDLQTPAVAAISSDSTLILSRDALHDMRPTTIKFDEIEGSAYRILNYDGNLVVLTRKAIYLLAGLSRRFLEQQPVGLEPTPVGVVILEAVDVNIADAGSLLVVMPDGVSLVDLEGFVGAAPSTEPADGLQQASPRGMSPQWEPHTNGLESESRVLAGTA
jgi:hypothetical protein